MSVVEVEPAPGADGLPAPERRRLVVVVLVALALLLGAVGYDALRPEGRPAAPPGSWTLTPHTGLGAWVDAYDWTTALGGPAPAFGPDDVEAMADAGVQTLYLQTAHRRVDEDVLEPERLDEILDAAHRAGLHVVAWYLPTLVDPATDLRRLEASAALRVDGLAVDIESTAVADVALRTQRTLELSRRLREALGARRTLAAITLSPLHVQVVNPAFWPGFPYAELAQQYDVLLPMSYWSLRRGELRDGSRHVADDLARIRAAVGPDVPLHAIGGIADDVTDGDLDGMVAAIRAAGAVGGSLYDWATSTGTQWARLAPLRDLHRAPGPGEVAGPG